MELYTGGETPPMPLVAPALGTGEVCQPQAALGHLRTQDLTDPSGPGRVQQCPSSTGQCMSGIAQSPEEALPYCGSLLSG